MLAPQKVLYGTTNFLSELNNCTPSDYDVMRNGPETDKKRMFEKMNKEICESDVVLIPYYPDRQYDSIVKHQMMLIVLRPRTFKATLITKANNDFNTEITFRGGEVPPKPTEQTSKYL